MGWELRGNRWYLYRNHRVGGRPVKEYLAAEDRFGLGVVMADDLRRLQARQRKVRALTRLTRAEYRAGIDELLAAAGAANADLRVVAEGVLYSLGYHRHNRGEWRMKRELAALKGVIETLKARHAGPTPVVKYDAPPGDAEAVEIFQKARAGDADAQAEVHALVRDRGWVGWLGDLGRQATRQLIHRAAGGDPVWAAGVTEKASTLLQQLLGDSPTVLEELLARRVVNGWVAAHALELELTLRPPAATRDRAHLDRALSRAQRRMTEAIGELARVRRLQAPKLLAQLNVAAAQTVVNGSGAGDAREMIPSRAAAGEC